MAGLDSARSGSAELAAGSRTLSDGINTATDPPLLKMTNLLTQISTQSDQVNGQVQDSSSALTQASTELDTITGAQDAAAQSLTSIIDNLSANQDPVSVIATGKLRETRDQLLAHQRTPGHPSQARQGTCGGRCGRSRRFHAERYFGQG